MSQRSARWPEAEWPTGLVVVVAVGNVSRPHASVIERLAAEISASVRQAGIGEDEFFDTY